MNKKIICIGIVSMFLLTSLTTLSAVETRTKNKNQLIEQKSVPNLLLSLWGHHACDVAVDSNCDVIVVGDEYTIKLDGNDGSLIWGMVAEKDDVAVDSYNNIIIGDSSGDWGDHQYRILILDKDGNELLTRTYLKINDSVFYDVAVDSYDNIILTGKAGDYPGSWPMETWTIKVDGETGDILAENAIKSRNQCAAVAVDLEDDIILMEDAIRVRKCDNDLIEQWSITTEYLDYSYSPESVTTDSQDNIIVCGWRSLPGSGSEFNFSYFTVKFDKNGVEVWDSPVIYDVERWDDLANAVAVDSQDNIIVAGDTGSENHCSLGYREWRTIKYDKDGNELWHRVVENAYNWRANGVAVDSSDNIIVIGSTCGSGTERYLTVKYNENGDVLWTNNGNFGQPPLTPSIDGSKSGRVGVEYTYAAITTDPNGDQVYYWFDWGDDTDSSWIGPYNSGQKVKASHTWNATGEYEIKVKAKDTIGHESEWEYLDMTIPRNKAVTTPILLQLLEKLINRFPILERLLGS